MGRPAVSTEKPQTPNARRLIVLASTLYGPQWQKPAAKALGIHAMAINRFVRQGLDPGDDLIEELQKIARQKAADIMKASKG